MDSATGCTIDAVPHTHSGSSISRDHFHDGFVLMKLHAVIVEDDPHLNYVYALTLKEDFEILAFTEGDVALDYFASHAQIPELVVLDFNLPRVSGLEILTAIRNDPHYDKTRVVLSTADERNVEYLHDKADLVLLKPVSPGQLRRLSQRICGIKELGDE